MILRTLKTNEMDEIEEERLKVEIAHIFDSGANEMRVLEMVKRFVNSRQPVSKNSSYTMLSTVPYQCCPICNGSGNVPAPSYTSGVTITCDTCSGQKIIPQHIVSEEYSR